MWIHLCWNMWGHRFSHRIERSGSEYVLHWFTTYKAWPFEWVWALNNVFWAFGAAVMESLSWFSSLDFPLSALAGGLARGWIPRAQPHQLAIGRPWPWATYLETIPCLTLAFYPFVFFLILGYVLLLEYHWQSPIYLLLCESFMLTIYFSMR